MVKYGSLNMKNSEQQVRAYHQSRSSRVSDLLVLRGGAEEEGLLLVSPDPLKICSLLDGDLPLFVGLVNISEQLDAVLVLDVVVIVGAISLPKKSLWARVGLLLELAALWCGWPLFGLLLDLLALS